MNFTQWLSENALGIAGIFGTSGAIYAAIRADLARMNEQILGLRKDMDYHRDRLDSLSRFTGQKHQVDNRD